MACRLDIRKAIVNDAMTRFVIGRNTFERSSNNTVMIVGKSDNKVSKAKSRRQAFLIAQDLSDRIEKYYNGHVMARVFNYSEYSPYYIELTVSDKYINKLYDSLPEDKKTDPSDKDMSPYLLKLNELMKKKGLQDQVYYASSPDSFLRYVAEQVYGITDGEYSNIDNAESSVERYYGKEIIDLAKEAYPEKTLLATNVLPLINFNC